MAKYKWYNKKYEKKILRVMRPGEIYNLGPARRVGSPTFNVSFTEPRPLLRGVSADLIIYDELTDERL